MSATLVNLAAAGVLVLVGAVAGAALAHATRPRPPSAPGPEPIDRYPLSPRYQPYTRGEPGTAVVKSHRSQEDRLLRRLAGSQTLMREVARGASMEEVARHGFSDAELQRSFSSFCSPTHPLHRGSRVAPDEVLPATKADHESRRHRTPREVILELQRGNGRFWMGLAERPEMNAMERRALIIAQAPSVCILGCSDSRVPVEIVFDQGLGDIFVVRLAGNMLDGSAHGSVEYAVKHLNVKVVMVLGHEGCGAVRGAMSMCEADLQNEPAHLQGLLRRIRAALPLERLNSITDHRARDREAVVANCTTLLQELLQTDVIVERVQDGRLVVCGAFYEITSGIVDFFSLDKHGMVCDVEEAVPPGSPPRSRNPSRAHSQLPAASTGSEDPAPGTPTALPNGRAGATE